jgi:hypothetical protein
MLEHIQVGRLYRGEPATRQREAFRRIIKRLKKGQLV